MHHTTVAHAKQANQNARTTRSPTATTLDPACNACGQKKRLTIWSGRGVLVLSAWGWYNWGFFSAFPKFNVAIYLYGAHGGHGPMELPQTEILRA